MTIAPSRHQHPSTGANRPSDVAVTVNIKAEFNLKPVNAIIEFYSTDLVLEYCQGLEACGICTASPFVVESFHRGSDRSLPHLPLQMHAEDIIPTILTSMISMGRCHPKALILKQHQSYKMIEVLLIISINDSMGLQGIVNFHLLRDSFVYRLARGLPLNEGVPYRQNPRSELEPLIFAEQFSHGRYHSTVDSTPSATLRRSIYMPTVTLDTSSRRSPPP
jgi:hypothetical protein